VIFLLFSPYTNIDYLSGSCLENKNNNTTEEEEEEKRRKEQVEQATNQNKHFKIKLRYF
jgi:hypothetical protein